MGLTPLRAFLARHRRIALDTSVFIYYLESNPSYLDLAGEVFARLESSSNTAATSTLTMTELLSIHTGPRTRLASRNRNPWRRFSHPDQ